MRVLIDTDVAIDYLRGQDWARRFLEEVWAEGEAYVSAVSAYELYCGGAEPEVEAFIGACRLLPVDRTAARLGAEWRRRWQATGLTLTTADCLIAGTALAHGLKIATRNIRHFPDPDLRLEI